MRSNGANVPARGIVPALRRGGGTRLQRLRFEDGHWRMGWEKDRCIASLKWVREPFSREGRMWVRAVLVAVLCGFGASAAEGAARDGVPDFSPRANAAWQSDTKEGLAPS